MNSASIRETSPFVEARRMLSVGSARAPTHDRTRIPGSRGVRRRTREAFRIARPQPGKSPRPSIPAAAPQSAPEPPLRLRIRHRCQKSGVLSRTRCTSITTSANPACHQSVSQNMHVGKRVHSMRLSGPRPRNGELLQGAGSKGAQKHQPARAQNAQALRQNQVDRVEPGHRHTRQNEVHAVRVQRQSLGLACDIPVPGKPAWCTRSGAAKQGGNGIDVHHIGFAVTARETPGHRAGARPEVENAPRRDANTVETLEQSVSRVLHDPCELGVAVAGAGKQATHRGSVECRRCSVPRGWPLCHG